jgi:hypothetical protein
VKIKASALLAAVLFAATFMATGAFAQDDDFLGPEQSSAKANALLQQAIDALGGNAYLNMKDITCTGKLGGFDHSGELTGYSSFLDYQQPPFKERQENLPKRNIITITNGNKGWDLDRGGVSDAPAADIAQNKEDIQRDIFNILKNRIHEKDMILRYGGADILDGWQVDWVEMVDGENRTIRIAIQRSTYLPVRKTVENRDPKSRTTFTEIEYYSNYHPIQGIQTPYQLTREKNQTKIFQAFFEKCDYNTNLSDELFTKESLEQQWAKVGKKEKERGRKEAERKKDKDDEKDKDSDADPKSKT